MTSIIDDVRSIATRLDAKDEPEKDSPFRGYKNLGVVPYNETFTAAAVYLWMTEFVQGEEFRKKDPRGQEIYDRVCDVIRHTARGIIERKLD